MITKQNLRHVVLVLLAGSLFVSCAQVTPSPSPTIMQQPDSVKETITPIETQPSTDTPVIVSPSPTSPPEEETPAITPTPTSEGSPWQLTFVSDRNPGFYGVYAIDVDCFDADELCLDEPLLLFEWEAWSDAEFLPTITSLDWSPDGNRVAFESLGNIFIADWNGENAIQIPSIPGSEIWPQWSPDGTQIAFIFGSDVEPAQIRVYDLQTGNTTRILEDVTHPSRVYWLPGGELAYIATVSETDRTELISIVNPDGTVIQQLPINATDYSHILGLDFSPDGQQLVFVGDIWPQTGKATTDIYVSSLKGGDVANLTNGAEISLAPVWSPIGDWIAFESNRSGDYDIYVVKSNGTHLTPITQISSKDIDPAWRVLRK